jgi:histidyl-tRNA synthetase
MATSHGAERHPAADAPASRERGHAHQPARPIERVRGTHDLLAAEYAATQSLLDVLAGLTKVHSYRFVDTPVLEHTELFLRKSGGDRVAQLYAFTHRGRDVALRPEFTASIMRLYIEQLQGEPLPLRLAYSGPVFRYEKPQAGRARQFTEFGCELIGASGPVADAEIIALALQGLQACGIERPRIVLGHIGVVIDFLSGLHIDQRAQDWLTWSMERLRKGDRAAHDLPPHLARLEAAIEDGPEVDELLDDPSPETIASILRQAGVEFQGGVRSPEEIVRGLFAKRRRRYDVTVLRGAAAFVEQLTALTGPPGEVLGPLRDLVGAHGLDTRPLDELETIVALLEALGCDPNTFTIDLGMGRGLHYYTGMLFEIYAETAGLQLCGGGRYDDLAQILGARQPVPACGFSYGIERVRTAATGVPERPSVPAVLVRQQGNSAAAARLAADLRQAGWAAAVDLRDRNASATFRAAERQGFSAIISRSADGYDITRISDGAISRHAQLPSPDEVL